MSLMITSANERRTGGTHKPLQVGRPDVEVLADGGQGELDRLDLHDLRLEESQHESVERRSRESWAHIEHHAERHRDGQEDLARGRQLWPDVHRRRALVLALVAAFLARRHLRLDECLVGLLRRAGQFAALARRDAGRHRARGGAGENGGASCAKGVTKASCCVGRAWSGVEEEGCGDCRRAGEAEPATRLAVVRRIGLSDGGRCS